MLVSSNWLVESKFQTLQHGIGSPWVDCPYICLDSWVFPLSFSTTQWWEVMLVQPNLPASFESISVSLPIPSLTSKQWVKKWDTKIPDLILGQIWGITSTPESPSESSYIMLEFYPRFHLYLALFLSCLVSPFKKNHLNTISQLRVCF